MLSFYVFIGFFIRAGFPLHLPSYKSRWITLQEREKKKRNQAQNQRAVVDTCSLWVCILWDSFKQVSELDRVYSPEVQLWLNLA